MTRKDYVLLAAAIKDAANITAYPGKRTPDMNQAIGSVARSISRSLGIDNAAFDSARFLKACGLTPDTHGVYILPADDDE